MKRIDATFRKLKKRGEKALIPFITAGDPDLATTRALALEMAKRGADVLELGIPFSDPLADGPTIQAASNRALKAGVHLQEVLELAGQVRRETEIPLVLMGYYNPILQYGLERTAREAKDLGVDGFIIPDLPLEEAGPWRKVAVAAGLAPIYLAAPTSGASRIKKAGRLTKGFLYYVSVTGITGAATPDANKVAAAVKHIKRRTALPVAVGFGVKTAEHARAIAKSADGVVVGSALMEALRVSLDKDGKAKAGTVKAVTDLVSQLAEGVRAARRVAAE